MASRQAAARIAAAFASHGRRAALMPYLMGGYPDLERSRDCLEAALDAGADLVELGIPFSDPLTDGPVIHSAAVEALHGGATTEEVLQECEGVSDRVPVVLMVYANVVLQGGDERFVRRAADAGAAGLIVPDLPLDEAAALRAACDAAGVVLVPLAAPTSAPERLAELAAAARGFVYAVSVSGTTGERDALPPDLARTVERVRTVTDLPVAVGFGISTAEQASAVAELADGVIVGSRVVRASADGPAAVTATVRELAQALA